ncbi:hypothetical protein VNI00_011306 [Paramarasmius palmivorus]|uniref:HNH nuclease domain-containing protein n=1 Tax=Paramarasmius palmivorus TaxID=297713 RepID=A0AAW0CBU2_9AGAR
MARQFRDSTRYVPAGKYTEEVSGLTSSPEHRGSNADYIQPCSGTPALKLTRKGKSSLRSPLPKWQRNRVVDRSRYGKRCGFSRESFIGNCDNEFFHAMERCTPEQTTQHLAPQWGVDDLDVDSSANIGVATSSLHKAFDSRAFILVPEREVLQEIKKYAANPGKKNDFEQIFKREFWVYTFMPLTWNKERWIWIKNLDESTEKKDEDRFADAPGYTHYNPCADHDTEPPPRTFEFHIHPFFMIYNAGQKLEVLQGSDVYNTAIEKDSRLIMIRQIYNIWMNEYTGPDPIPPPPTDHEDDNDPEVPDEGQNELCQDGERKDPVPAATEGEETRRDEVEDPSDKGKRPLRVPELLENLGNYADSSDDEPDQEEPGVGRKEASRVSGDEQSTIVPPGPPQSTVAGPSSAVDGDIVPHGRRRNLGGRRAKSMMSAPLLERLARDNKLGGNGKRQAAMTDGGYIRNSSPDSAPGSSPTPQNRLGSPFPLSRQGTSTSIQPLPALPKLLRAHIAVGQSGNVRLGQNLNQDSQGLPSSSLDVQAQALRRSSRPHRGSVAGRSTGSGGTMNSSARTMAGPGPGTRSTASAGSSRARLGGGSLRVPVEDPSDESGDGSGEYLPNNSKRRKQKHQHQ